MDRITMPSALLSCLLLIPLRGQESCQKQVVIGHRGRSAKKIRFFFAIAVFLTGCSTIKEPLATNRPQALCFEFIGLPGASIDKYELQHNGLLVYTYSVGGKRHDRAVVSPDEARWTDFYQVLDRLRAWDWRENYSYHDTDPKMFVDDGMQWTFTIQSAGKKVASAGDNAVPSLTNPNQTISDSETIFFSKKNSLYELRSALARLTGQRSK